MSDPKPCPDCGHLHVTKRGLASCKAHGKTSGKPCTQPPMHGQEICKMHGGKAPQNLRAAERRLALAAADELLEHLGRRTPIESIPEAMLALVEEAAANVAVYRRLVQQLEMRVDQYPGDVGVGVGIAVRTGNEKKLNEAERHIWVALYDEERDRLMRWLGECRKLGIEEARLEQRERVARDQADVLVLVIRTIVDGLRDALVAAGLAGELLEQVYRERLPGIVRQAIEARVIDDGGAAA